MNILAKTFVGLVVFANVAAIARPAHAHSGHDFVLMTAVADVQTGQVTLHAGHNKHWFDKTGRSKTADDSFSVSIYSNGDELNSVFNEQLQAKNEGVVESCDMAIVVSFGRADTDYGFGGYCHVVKDAKDIDELVCADKQDGLFQLKESGSVTIEDLTQFVNEHCLG